MYTLVPYNCLRVLDRPISVVSDCANDTFGTLHCTMPHGISSQSHQVRCLRLLGCLFAPHWSYEFIM